MYIRVNKEVVITAALLDDLMVYLGICNIYSFWLCEWSISRLVILLVFWGLKYLYVKHCAASLYSTRCFLRSASSRACEAQLTSLFFWFNNYSNYTSSTCLSSLRIFVSVCRYFFFLNIYTLYMILPTILLVTH